MKILNSEVWASKALFLITRVFRKHWLFKISSLINQMSITIKSFDLLILSLNFQSLKFKLVKFKFWILFIFEMSSSNNYSKFVPSKFGAISILPKVDKVVDLKSETLLIEAKWNTELDTLGFNTFNNILKIRKNKNSWEQSMNRCLTYMPISLLMLLKLQLSLIQKWLASLSTILLVLTLLI